MAITEGDRLPTRRQYDVFAVALNEHFAGLGHGHPVPAWGVGA